jgi:hypothetical protein
MRASLPISIKFVKTSCPLIAHEQAERFDEVGSVTRYCSIVYASVPYLFIHQTQGQVNIRRVSKRRDSPSYCHTKHGCGEREYHYAAGRAQMTGKQQVHRDDCHADVHP